ncbi:hypothetical protein Rsub_09146 [Raphidocelis subcapitata]|uniref:VTT domain-containing protein n=1 Tax=Raphidocelis subcapitata TaxID=307507 RepID=A0A2V0PF79_9CHLO|nr:hypothetical protein Rsub_09146 [Raphidocelis subcapitata]|eukprot:GBF96563.1 hypothetical protein Rsub_09146 [Raphidocelis subcapitata]
MQQQFAQTRPSATRAAGRGLLRPPQALPRCACPGPARRRDSARRSATSQQHSSAGGTGTYAARTRAPSAAPGTGSPRPSAFSAPDSSGGGGDGGGSGTAPESGMTAHLPPAAGERPDADVEKQPLEIERSPSPIAEILLRSLDGTETPEAAPAAGGGVGVGRGGAIAAAVGFIGGLLLLLGAGYVFRGPIKDFLEFFIDAVDEWGAWGYVAYAAVYTGLEVLAVPAIPLTMTAGAIFGPLVGTAIVSASATTAATIAFLIARYLARDKVLAYAQRNKRFAAVDRAISQNGLKFVTLLRLSPLLPLAASNYIYGLTSVDLGSYVLGSWLGMLPGTYAYVAAGHVGKAIMIEGGEGSGLSVAPWQVVVGLTASLLAIGFIGQLAKRAVEEADSEPAAAAGGGGAGGGPAAAGGGGGFGPRAGSSADEELSLLAPQPRDEEQGDGGGGKGGAPR